MRQEYPEQEKGLAAALQQNPVSLERQRPLVLSGAARGRFLCPPTRARCMGQTVELMDRITVNPDQCGGRPCVRGMRIRVSDVLELLAAGLSTADVLAEMPDLDAADIAACLRFASRRLDHPVLAA